MPANRVHMAIPDLVREVRDLRPLAEDDEAPIIELGLDENDFGEVLRQLSSAAGRELPADPTFDGVAVRYAGMRIVMRRNGG